MQIMQSMEVESDKQRFQSILNGKGEAQDYVTSLAILSRQLAWHDKKPVIILIDEYDVPLENAYF